MTIFDYKPFWQTGEHMALATSSCIKTRMLCFNYTEKGLLNNCTTLHSEPAAARELSARKFG